MVKADYYKRYQENLELLEIEMELIKKTTQTHLGMFEWVDKESHDIGKLENEKKAILAGTRLYSFLLCSWFEARLYKIVYEASSVAFTDSEISSIMSQDKMDKNWKMCYAYAICKNYGFTYSSGKNYSMEFALGSMERLNYEEVMKMIEDIKNAITVRNRLAHGQWSVQFNASRNAIATYDFFSKYDNIQKLVLLKEKFSLIAEIISDYVVFKDKTSGTRDFNDFIHNKIMKVQNIEVRISKHNFKKYCTSFYNIEKRKREKYS